VKATVKANFQQPTVAPGISRLIPAGAVWSWFLVVAAGWMAAAVPLGAQSFNQMQPEQLMQLMLAAPKLVTDLPIAPAAAFDPPVIAPGGKAVYRVSLHTLDEAITRWPDKLPVPPQLELTRGAEGMVFNMAGGTMKPLTVLNFHATAARAGVYVIPSYEVEIYGQPVTIPEARLEVRAGIAGLPSARQLYLEPAKTNVYVGESVRVRVLNPAAENRMVQMMSEVKLNGDGFITGKGDVRQQIAPVHLANGQDLTAFIYDTSITPFTRGPLKIFAQGFTSGNSFGGGQIVIQGGVTIPGGPPEYALLESEPVTLNVKPLPAEGRLPGFNGAIGKFTRDQPQLSAASVTAGNPVKLTVTFHSEGGLLHLAMPPAPATPAWEAFAAAPAPGGNSVTFTYTLIPQTSQTAATPEIPFCCFDPELDRYVNLSIPALPVKVLPGAEPLDFTNGTGLLAEAPEKQLSLSPPTPGMGRTAAALVPLQERGWFFAVELGPVLGLLLAWLASRRRQFLEQHPSLLRRRQARKALRREWRALRRAAQSGDARGFATGAVQAIRLACAPHFPAEPRALVCGDVLQLLPEAERAGESGGVVRRLFRAVDALDYAVASGVRPSPGAATRNAERTSELSQNLGHPGEAAPGPGALHPLTGAAEAAAGLLEWQPQVDRLLARLEAQL
jgi:hypothetical protein